MRGNDGKLYETMPYGKYYVWRLAEKAHANHKHHRLPLQALLDNGDVEFDAKGRVILKKKAKPTVQSSRKNSNISSRKSSNNTTLVPVQRNSNLTANSSLPCGGKPFTLQSPCFQDHLGKLTGKVFAEKESIVKKGGTSCGKDELNAHQVAVFEMARAILQQGQAVAKQRGLVCFHATGSGKTNTCLAIIIAAKLAERATGIKFRIVLATTPSNRRGNSELVYRENLKRFFPQFQSLFPPNKMDFSLESYTASNWYGKQPTASSPLVLLADECQNLIIPAKEVQAYAANLSHLRRWLMTPEVKRHSYFFGLSGTPGETVESWIDVLNLASLSGETFSRRADPRAFGKLISYVDPRGDRSMYGTLVDKKPINVDVPMNEAHYLLMLKTVASGKYDEELRKGREFRFYKMPLQKTSLLTKTEAMNVLGYQEENWFEYGDRQLYVGTKLLKVAENAKNMQGKQYVFAADPTVAKSIEAVLDASEANRLSVKDIPEPPGRGVKISKDAIDVFFAKHAPKLRFVSFGTGVRPGGSQDARHLAVFKEIFNDPRNKHGEYVKIMIATQSFYVGIDLKGLRGVHIAQPLPTVADDLQAVGRALRGCGHAELDPSNRNARVLRYFATAPPSVLRGGDVDLERLEEVATAMKKKISFVQAVEKMKAAGGIDPNRLVYHNAVRRHKNLGVFEQSVKGVALDCALFKSGFHSGENFQCAPPGSVRRNTNGKTPSSKNTPRRSSKSTPRSSRKRSQ